MVVVKVMLRLTLIASLILLAEFLLPVVVGVAPLVAPLECIVGGDVNVLGVVVPGVCTVRPGLWEGDAPGSSGSWSLRSGKH